MIWQAQMVAAVVAQHFVSGMDSADDVCNLFLH